MNLKNQATTFETYTDLPSPDFLFRPEFISLKLSPESGLPKVYIFTFLELPEQDFVTVANS
jgi:hypothetical protein